MQGMPVDKDMYRTVTTRFSLLNQNHVRLLEQMEQECRAGSNALSKTEPLPAKAGRFELLLKQPKVVSAQGY